jgi:hypothetical protein
MFPNGWPGTGLLLLRLTGGSLLLVCGSTHWFGYAQLGPGPLIALSFVLSILMVLGLWTPVAGVLLAGVDGLFLMKRADDPRLLLCLLGIHLAVAMLGPGVISIDAVLFGRHRLKLNAR